MALSGRGCKSWSEIASHAISALLDTHASFVDVIAIHLIPSLGVPSSSLLNLIFLPLFVRQPLICYRCGLDVFIAPLGGVIGKIMKLFEGFMH